MVFEHRWILSPVRLPVPPLSLVFFGPEGSRTLDLYNAIVAFYQLNYRPLIRQISWQKNKCGILLKKF